MHKGGGRRLGDSSDSHSSTSSDNNLLKMARRVPMSCCTGGPCGGSSTLAGAAAPFLVQVATGGAESLTRPLDLAYWLGLQDSYTTKVPLSLKSVVTLIRTLEGRDKVTKVR